MALSFGACELISSTETSGEITNEIVELSQEELFAGDLCACIGAENQKHLVEMAEMMRNDQNIAETSELYREKFTAVNQALFNCMAELETKYANWEGEKSEELVRAAVKAYCQPFADYIDALEASSAKGSLTEQAIKLNQFARIALPIRQAPSIGQTLFQAG